MYVYIVENVYQPFVKFFKQILFHADDADINNLFSIIVSVSGKVSSIHQ